MKLVQGSSRQNTKLRRRYRFLDYNPCMTKLVQTQMDAAASEYLWLRRVQAAGAAGSEPGIYPATPEYPSHQTGYRNRSRHRERLRGAGAFGPADTASWL